MSTAVESRKFEKITSGKFKGMFKTVLSTGTMAVAKKGENGTYYVWHFISKDGEVRHLDNNFTRDSRKLVNPDHLRTTQASPTSKEALQ